MLVEIIHCRQLALNASHEVSTSLYEVTAYILHVKSIIFPKHLAKLPLPFGASACLQVSACQYLRHYFYLFQTILLIHTTLMTVRIRLHSLGCSVCYIELCQRKQILKLGKIFTSLTCFHTISHALYLIQLSL